MSTFIQKARYRSGQFFKALGARLTADDRALIESVLTTPAQQALFDGMPPADQRHAVDVLRTLRADGHNNQALMQAALLHDAAKSGAGITIFHRVAVVLLKAFRPSWLTWLARDAERSFLRRPLARYLNHPQIGAHWARKAGCHPLAVSLIRRHQAPIPSASGEFEDQLLGALQAADSKN